MPSKNKVISIYPDPTAARIVGGPFPQHCNRAVECWAHALKSVAAGVSDRFSRDEWNLLADALNGHAFIADEGGGSLAMSVLDADEFEGVGKKWGVNVEDLSGRLQRLSYVQARCVVEAVLWFWANHESVDPREDPWWDLGFRVRRTGDGDMR